MERSAILYAELSEIEGEDDFTPLGHVPLAWVKPRLLGSAEHDGKYAGLYGSDWIGLLRKDLAADCLELGITELDASALQGSTARALTQRASRLARLPQSTAPGFPHAPPVTGLPQRRFSALVMPQSRGDVVQLDKLKLIPQRLPEH